MSNSNIISLLSRAVTILVENPDEITVRLPIAVQELRFVMEEDPEIKAIVQSSENQSLDTTEASTIAGQIWAMYLFYKSIENG